MGTPVIKVENLSKLYHPGERPVRMVGKWDRALISIVVCVIAFTAIAFWLSSGKQLWLDELFTWYQVKDKSFGELIDACRTGFNLMPPGYFLGLWSLDKLGLLSEWMMRLVSIAAAVFGLVVLGVLLVRRWGSPFSSILMGIFVGSCSPLLVYSVEARPYALAFLLAVLSLAMVGGLNGTPITRPCVVGNAVLSFALPSVSYPSGIYSAALLVGYLVQCWTLRKRPSWGLIVSFLIGWGLFIALFGTVLLNQFGHNRKGTLTSTPNVFACLGAYSELMSFPLGVLCVWLVLTVLCRREGEDVVCEHGPKSAASLLPVFFWLLVPLGCYALAKAGIATVWGVRFFLPSAVAIVAVIGHFSSMSSAALLRQRSFSSWAMVLIPFAAILGLIIQAASIRSAAVNAPVRKFSAQLSAEERSQALIINELNTYFHLLHYAPDLTVRVFGGNQDNQALLRRVSNRMVSVVGEDLFNERAFTILVDRNQAAWATTLRRDLLEHGFTLTAVRDCSSPFISELWSFRRVNGKS